MACKLEFYQNLYEFCSEYYNDFLEKFNDLTFVDLPVDLKENEGVKNALLRNDGITKSKDIIDFNSELQRIEFRIKCW